MTQNIENQEVDFEFVPDQFTLSQDQVMKLLEDKVGRAEVQVQRIADLMDKMRKGILD
jgi:hypothetical protein